LFKFRSNILIGCLFAAGAFLLTGCKSKKSVAASPRSAQQANQPLTDSQKEVEFGYHYVTGCGERMKGNLQIALKEFEECKKLDPQNVAVNYELGTIFKLLGNNTQALDNALVCANADPKNEWYQLLLVDCYNTSKQYKQALKVREALVKNFPNKSEFKEELAIEYAVVGQYDKSFKIYEELEKNYGINEQITLNKVKLLKSQGKRKEAEEELIKLSNSNKKETRYYSYLAEFYLEQNELEKAKGIYDKILEVDPSNALVNLALQDYYSNKGMEDEAFKYLKKAFENPDLDINTKANILSEYYKSAEHGDQRAFTQGLELSGIMIRLHPKATEANGIYADFLRRDNRLAEASGYYYQAAANEKRNFRIWKNLLYVDSDLRRYDSLEHHSTLCMELFPTMPDGYLFNGIANSQLKNYKKAVQSLQDGLELSGGNKAYALDFLRALGDGYNYLKEYTKSDKAFDEALKLDPDNTYVLNNYAYYLSLRNENLDKAEKYAKRTIELKPGESSYMDTLGWILYMEKKYTEAEVWLSKACLGNPSDATLLEHYGDVLFRLNKVQDALKQWTAAKQAGGQSDALDRKIKSKKLDD
jgi:tetratricopeptide (TPR) repeat protein